MLTSRERLTRLFNGQDTDKTIENYLAFIEAGIRYGKL